MSLSEFQMLVKMKTSELNGVRSYEDDWLTLGSRTVIEYGETLEELGEAWQFHSFQPLTITIGDDGEESEQCL